MIVDIIMAAAFVFMLISCSYVDKHLNLSLLHRKLSDLYKKLRFREITIKDFEYLSEEIFKEMKEIDNEVYEDSYNGFLRVKRAWEE